MLGLAKECPDLLLVEGTTNVIEEIGRASLKVASLIHEYTKPEFIGRSIPLLIDLFDDGCFVTARENFGLSVI